MNIVRAVRWSDDAQAVTIIDQRLLPGQFVERELRDLDAVCSAIRTLAVRGAPAIGVCAALGLVASLTALADVSTEELAAHARAAAATIRATRPTAVNLPWAMDRMLQRLDRALERHGPVIEALKQEADAILAEDRSMCARIAEFGEPLIPDGARVLTHCNAGALATAGMGTALAPLYRAAQSGKQITVFAGETRPLLQGSRLTAWELARANIPVTVVTDGMVGALMRRGAVDLCLVGADRIAANGDVANKIGTYAVAVLARHHGIPFYVAAPESTLDRRAPSGDAIVIEERSPDEVARPFGATMVADGASVWNPAFDITPAELITAIITDTGVVRPPYRWPAPDR